MKVTKREIIFSVAIVAVMLIFGIVLSDKINDSLMNSYQEYNTALQINDVPEIFKEYRCIIFWLVCDNGQQIDKRIENTKESMDFKNIEIMSEKEEKQFWIKNMYKVNTTGKIPEQVCSEIIQQVDLLKTSLH